MRSLNGVPDINCALAPLYTCATFDIILPQAVVVSDVIVMYILKKGKFYRQKKYLNVNDSEAEGEYEIINNPADDLEGSKEAIPVPVSHVMSVGASGGVYNSHDSRGTIQT